MSLPPSVGTVRLRGMVVHPDTGVPIRSGRVVITYPYPVYATTDAMTVLPGKVTAKITNGAWLSGLLLDPNDTDLTPQGYAYILQIFSDEWNPDPRLVAIPPGSAGLTLDLTALGETTTAPAITTYALVSQLALYVAKGTLTAKGALLVATAAGIVGQLAAGGNGLVLTTDSSTPTGLKWVAGGGGGGGILTVNGQSGPDVELDAADVGAAAETHDHVTADILGLAAYIDARAATLIAALVDAAPGTLDTLNELAAALGDDPNFAATITGLLAGKQPLDADLTTFAALAPADDTVVQRKAGTWTARTPAQVKADLVLVRADVGLGNVDNTSDSAKPVSTATQTALDAKLGLSLIDAAGDLLVGSADNTATRLAKGSNSQILTVTAGAVGWADPPAAAALAEVDGFVCWTGDPLNWTTLSGLGDGNTQWVALPVPAGEALTNLWVCVGAAGSYLASSGRPNQLAVSDRDGTLLSLTPNDSTLYTAQGWRSGALTTPQAAQSVHRWVYVGLIVGDMTGLQLRYPTSASTFGGSTDVNTINGGPEPRRRSMYANGLSALPSSFDPTTYGAVTPYLPLVAIS